MKKILAILVVLVIVLAACGQKAEPTVTSTEPSTEASVPTTEPTQETVQIPDCDTPNWWAENYDDYLSYVSDAPEGFVHYEQIRWMGGLQWIRIPYSFQSITSAQTWFYAYYMKDGADFNIELRIGKIGISHSDAETAVYPTTTAVDPTDMRQMTQTYEGECLYYHGDIVYKYRNGRLEAIRFMTTGWSDGSQWGYAVSGGLGGAVIGDYPADCTGTFVSDLLSLEAADEAVEEFLTAINSPVPTT